MTMASVKKTRSRQSALILTCTFFLLLFSISNALMPGTISRANLNSNSIEQSISPCAAFFNGPITISSNDDFTPAHGVSSGAGTESDPWRIENIIINGSQIEVLWATGIQISNTTDHFIINGIKIQNYLSPIVRLSNVSNSIVENISKTEHGLMVGVSIQNSSHIVVRDVELVSNEHCVQISNSSDISILDVTASGGFSSNIQAISSTDILISECHFSNFNYITNTYEFPIGIDLQSSNNVKILRNHVDFFGTAILLNVSSNNVIQENEITLSWRGVDIHSSNDNQIISNTFIGNQVDVVQENSSNVVIGGNTYLTGDEGMLVLTICVIAGFIIFALAFASHRRKNQPNVEETIKIAPFSMPSTAAGTRSEVRADFSVSFKLLLKNVGPFLITGIVAFILYFIMARVLSFVAWASPFSSSRIYVFPDESVRVGYVMFFIIDLFIFYAFFNCQFGLSYEIFTSGNMFATIKDAYTHFKNHGFEYALITLLMGIGMLTNPLPRFSAPDHIGLISLPIIPCIIWTVIHFVLVVIFVETFPALTNQNGLLAGLIENFKIVRRYPLRLLKTWGLYFLIFIVPPLILSSSLNLVDNNNQAPSPIYYMATTAEIVSLIIRFPLMTLISNRVYNNLKYGSATGVVSGPRMSPAWRVQQSPQSPPARGGTSA